MVTGNPSTRVSDPERSVIMNWYAYKLLADSYAAERRHEAQTHRRVRHEAAGRHTSRRPQWWPGRPR